MSKSKSITPERGSASLVIDLTDSCITVIHGTDNTVLARKTVAQLGDWDRLIDFLRHDLGVKWLVND
jgi:hypothetical protein